MNNLQNIPEPRFKKGDLVYYFDHDKGEVFDDTVTNNPTPCLLGNETYVYGLFKRKCFMEEKYLFKTPLECLNACYINAQDEMIGAELELKTAQRNVQFFYDLCKEEQKRIESEKVNQPCE